VLVVQHHHALVGHQLDLRELTCGALHGRRVGARCIDGMMLETSRR
jgi:hypothetical protein